MQRIVAGHLRGRRPRALPDGVEVGRPGRGCARRSSRASTPTSRGRACSTPRRQRRARLRGALARASQVVAIDRDARVIRHLEAQAADFGVGAALELPAATPPTILARTGERAPFDLVFIDPPYAEVALVAEVLEALAVGGWLAADADVVVERARIRGRAPQIELPAGFRVEATRTYGQTAVEFLRGPAPHAIQPADDQPQDL
ncbi:MAG: RsmD family RNA methyltransferase [Nannocystaceae bacterium]